MNHPGEQQRQSPPNYREMDHESPMQTKCCNNCYHRDLAGKCGAACKKYGIAITLWSVCDDYLDPFSLPYEEQTKRFEGWV